MAAPHPAMTSMRRRENSRAAMPATTSPAVIQTGGRPGPPGLSISSERAGRSGLARPRCCTPTSSSSSAGCAASWTVHGSSTTGGTITAMPRLRRTDGRPTPTAAAATTAASTATIQVSGTKAAAIAIVRPVAQAARRARRGGSVNILAASRAISGSRAKATAVPSRPAAMAPIATGSSAYAAAAQILTSAERVTRRTARKAKTPASGTQPNRITSTASHGLPPSTVARAATTAMYGGALLPEPIPDGWKPCRYSCHRPDTPPQAGTRAPPPRGPPLSNDRPATSATSVRPRKSATPGWVRMRCARPVSMSRESSSVGSSVA